MLVWQELTIYCTKLITALQSEGYYRQRRLGQTEYFPLSPKLPDESAPVYLKLKQKKYEGVEKKGL